MPTTSKTNITIIGASISGLTLALSLLKIHKLPSSSLQILETRSKDSKPGGPIALTPNSLRLLDQLGVEAKLRTKGYTFAHSVYRDADGNYKGYMPFGGKQQWGYDALRIQRSELIAVLKSEVEALGGRIECDCSLREVVSEDSNGVTFHVRKGGHESGDIVTMHTNILIGCDGLHSKTRTFVLGGREVEPIYNGTVMIATHANNSKLRYTHGFEKAGHNKERALSVLTKKGGIYMIPSDPEGEDMLLARQFPVPDRSREEWEAFGADKASLRRMLTSDIEAFPDFVQSALEQAKADEGTYIWAVRTLPKLERWISAGRRIVIVGDAAHTVIPAAGQGANQALEDARSLAEILAKDASLEEWQMKRMKKVEKVAKLSMQLMNMRLPAEEQAKLAKDELFDMSGGVELGLTWLYAPTDEDVQTV